ncbi:MAG: hypothetical protein HY055_12775 [Magnetospirillum sp.]|nr:hypothetical protein [Magnetospirillum sp.]
MLATSALSANRHVVLRCNVCRYFAQDRCCNATARLDGFDDRDGECPFFRFAQSLGAPAVWELR